MPNRWFYDRPLTIFQTPKHLAIFYEADGAFREIHTDGRKLPEDPFPSWLGYSSGHWDGDTLVVDSNGYNERTRFPGGFPHSEALHVQERFRRRDFGHMDIDITLTDPAMLTKPVTVKVSEILLTSGAATWSSTFYTEEGRTGTRQTCPLFGRRPRRSNAPRV